VSDRLQKLLPWIFAVLLALSRWPGLLPPNFSAIYALCLCGGLCLPGRLGWALPMSTILVSDLALNCWYHFGKGYDVWNRSSLLYLVGPYTGSAVLFLLGRSLSSIGRWSRWQRILPAVTAGLFGAILFYVVTNTLAWLLNPFRNPEYVKTLAGWWTALTAGTKGWPQAWEFFRNSLLSSALFSALFAFSWQAASSESPVEKGECTPPAESEAEPEEQAA